MSDPLAVSRAMYDLMVASTTSPPPAIRTWTGDTWGPADATTTIVLNHPGALRAALLPPSDLTAGEAYIFDDIDIEGDIFGLFGFAAELDGLRSSPRAILKAIRLLRQLPAISRRKDATRPKIGGRLHSVRRDSSAVRHHYDTGNDFFQLFLDEEMAYSCAYFLDPAESLEVAQHRKLDLICRKMQLQPGQRLLDVGCGWGALLRHAAKHYGVEAVGVTLSPEQAAEATRRIAADGLEHRVTVEVRDYRTVSGEFEAISSVGMFEHVGRGQLDTYFSKLFELLTPDGLLLNHGITNRDRPGRLHRKRRTFVNTYVFPDGELVPIEETVGIAERAGFEARDIESLRQSYALTLRHWVNRLQSQEITAVAASDRLTYRIWRVYMAGSVAAFATAGISVYQAIYTKRDTPWTYGRRWAIASDDH